MRLVSPPPREAKDFCGSRILHGDGDGTGPGSHGDRGSAGVIVREGVVLAAAHNGREKLRDPTAHAEMIAITQAAAAIESWRLVQCTLYVTLEPCPMCAGAILQARLSKVVYGADDPKAGAVNSLFQLLNDSRLNHQVEVESGIMAEPCGQVLTDFFTQKRLLRKK